MSPVQSQEALAYMSPVPSQEALTCMSPVPSQEALAYMSLFAECTQHINIRTFTYDISTVNV